MGSGEINREHAVKGMRKNERDGRLEEMGNGERTMAILFQQCLE